MCGIAGWFSKSPVKPIEVDQLKTMIRVIAHRGPDGQGSLLRGNAALGHARLAIIDIEGGAQPMSTADDGVAITFNGEIYNYAEVRKYLIQRGRRFRTHSDTEVILQLYEEEGWQGFSRLRGMYAFAIWDARQKLGLLARDPLGIKPLFLRAASNGDIEFASEAKAILARNHERGELDENSLHLLMNFRYLPGKRSLFRNIIQLSPGKVLQWQPTGKVREHTITLPSDDPPASTLDTLRDSVRVHFTADVEVGVYLSGGLDSASVTALAKDLGYHALRTFTLNIGDDPNEARNAARTAALLGVTNIQDHSIGNLSELLPKLVWHLELPKINAFQVNQLAKLASRHVKVALSGLGGDEIFLGYNAHRILHQAHRLASIVPAGVTRTAGRMGARSLTALPGISWSESERALRMLQSLGDWPRVYALLRNVWDTPAMRQALYGPRLLDQRLSDAFAEVAALWPADPDPVMAMAAFERQHKLVNDLLWQEDRASMAEGVEVRVPFVDVAVNAHFRTLKRETLMPSGHTKSYMRKILKPILPQEVMARPKSGFQIDAPFFFQQHLAAHCEQLLDDTKVLEVGLFNPTFIKQVRQRRARTGLRWHYFVLYLMIMAHLWVDVFERDLWTPATPRWSN